MRGYGDFCPIAIASEVFAERWTPLVVRELYCGSHRFNDLLRGLPRMPRSVLVQRLRTLEATGVVERRVKAQHTGVEYHLTDAGQELSQIVLELGDWGKRWAHTEVRPERIDTDLLVWDMHRRLATEEFPAERTVIHIAFTGAVERGYWLILEHGAVSVCWNDPGFEPDVILAADTVVLHQVWLGQVSFSAALRQGKLKLSGRRNHCQAFPGWLQLSVFATR
jgi:DNA-binding HxlR family transcriptional regulator